MQRIYEPQDLLEAELLCAMLGSEGVEVHLVGRDLLGAVGELPLFGVLRVCVPDPCLADAEAALHAAGLNAQGPAQGDPAPVVDDGSGLLPA